MKQQQQQKKEERSTLNQRSTSKEEERSVTSRSTGEATGIRMIAVEELHEHPKALAFWPQGQSRADAAALLAESVARDGIKQPLTVCRRPEGGWWVIDGCTRLAAARAAGLAEAPCHEIAANDETVEDEIYIANLVRTSASCGMRILRYLERHHDQVLAAAIVHADPARSGALGGRGNKGCLSGSVFSAVAIAERLKVHRQDVGAAIELLRCRAERKVVAVEPRSGSRILVPASDDEAAGVDDAYRRVLDGTPPRRWLAAAKGHVATDGKAKAPTDYAAVAARALCSLGTVFGHWNEMADAAQAEFVKVWKRTVANMPPDVLLATRKLLPPM